MSNDKKYTGKIVAMLYNTRSGKTARSMPLDAKNLAQLAEILKEAGPGSKLALKPTSDEYRTRKARELRKNGKNGSPAEYILEILSAEELQEERERLNSNSVGL